MSSSLTTKRRELDALFDLGAGARHEIDVAVGRHMSDPVADIRKILSFSDDDGLVRLQDAFAKDRVIRRSYVNQRGGVERRCLMGWLFGHGSRREMFDHPYPDVDTFLSGIRVIRTWDYNELSTSAVIEALQGELEQRGLTVMPLRETAAMKHAALEISLSG